MPAALSWDRATSVSLLRDFTQNRLGNDTILHANRRSGSAASGFALGTTRASRHANPARVHARDTSTTDVAMCCNRHRVHSSYFSRTDPHALTTRVRSRAVRRGLVVFARPVEANGFLRSDQVDSARQGRVLVSDPRRRAAGALSGRAQSGVRLDNSGARSAWLPPNLPPCRHPPRAAFQNIRRIG